VTLLVSTFYFCYFAIVGIYVIFMPKMFIDIGYSAVDVGIIYAVAPLVRFVIPFIFAKFFTLSRTVFNMALIVMSISTLLFALYLEQFWILLCINVFLGIGMALILPYIEVIALEHIGKEHYGRARLWGSVGFIVVALMLAKISTEIPFILGSLIVTTFATAVVGYVIVRSDSLKQQHAPSATISFSLLSNPWLWVGFFLMQVSFGAFYNFFTIYETSHGVSLEWTVYLWSAAIVAEILLFYFQAPLLRKNLLLLLQFATVITALRWSILWLYPDNLAMLFISQTLHAISFALFHAASISYLYTIYIDKKLAQQFFLGISYGLGSAVGAVGAGLIYEHYPEQLFIVAALVALMAYVALRSSVVYDKRD